MDRRTALSYTASLMGTAIIGSQAFLTGCSSNESGKQVADVEKIRFLDEIGEIIIPETEDSPGAKAARIGEFMMTMVNDCYSEKEKIIFYKGIETINEQSIIQYGKVFLETDPEERITLIKRIDEEARKGKEGKPHYFTMMKQLTIWGYFTSEPGATKALRYNPIPGRYEGCVPYEGEKAWA